MRNLSLRSEEDLARGRGRRREEDVARGRGRRREEDVARGRVGLGLGLR